jgi:ABC-type phosphate/phosphonate transport system substrate-binding protein
MRRTYWGLCGLALFLLSWTAGGPAPAGGAAPLRVGMVQTFFHDLPKPMVAFVTEPFAGVMRETTGLSGELLVGGDAFTVAKQLAAGKFHLAVFHGFEFAWVQQRHPELRPLMLAVNSQRSVSAYVLVRKDSPATELADLKGTDFALPKRTREHARLFVERHCPEDGSCAPKDFFGHIVSSANVETALDDLCKGTVQAAVVDSIGLAFYKDLKPGCFARLRVLKESGDFPPAVIAYRSGGLSDETLGRLREGLLSAHKTERGREMMKVWALTGFVNIPADFPQVLAESLKAYPAPRTP